MNPYLQSFSTACKEDSTAILSHVSGRYSNCTAGPKACIGCTRIYSIRVSSIIQIMSCLKHFLILSIMVRSRFVCYGSSSPDQGTELYSQVSKFTLRVPLSTVLDILMGTSNFNTREEATSTVRKNNHFIVFIFLEVFDHLACLFLQLAGMMTGPISSSVIHR